MRKIIFDRIASPLAQAIAVECKMRDFLVLEVGDHDIALFLKQQKDIWAILADVSVVDESGSLAANGEGAAIEDFAAAVQQEINHFLALCNAATRALLGQKCGQVWALGVDDAAAALVGNPSTPIINQARIGCIKSLAKEYGHTGLRFNTLMTHPPQESVDNWRVLRDPLKVYGSRYTANSAEHFSTLLMAMLKMPSLPVNGGVLCLGSGVMEMGV